MDIFDIFKKVIFSNPGYRQSYTL